MRKGDSVGKEKEGRRKEGEEEGGGEGKPVGARGGRQRLLTALGYKKLQSEVGAPQEVRLWKCGTKYSNFHFIYCFI